MYDLLGGENWKVGEKLGWHRSMGTAKPQQLLLPCFEQRVGADRLQTVPSCEASSQGETKPRLLQAASVLERRMLEADPKDSTGGLQGRRILHCSPSHEKVAPLPSGAVGSTNSGGRMELAGPRPAALLFGQGSAAGPKNFGRRGRKEKVGSRSCGTGQPSRHSSSTAQHRLCG